MSKYFFLYTIVWFFMGCKGTLITNEKQNITEQQVSLGSIGLEKDFMLQNEFVNTAFPCYKNSIKLAIKVKPFKKQTFKSFTKAKDFQTAGVTINYIDSLDVKPKYVQIDIADKVSFINELNNHYNSGVKSYLKLNKHTNILTSVSLALNQKDIENITSAKAIFLVESGLKSYALKLYKNDTNTEIIQFNQGVVFAYKTSNCCWQENSKHKLNIVDLVSEFNDCPFKTYRSSKRAKQKVNYYKL